MDIKDTDIEKERIHCAKFSKDFDVEYVKEHLETAPCNIWAYIKVLEERITQLEKKQ